MKAVRKSSTRKGRGRGKARRPDGVGDEGGLRREARRRIDELSADRLRVAVDFLSYLHDRELNEATKELLRIPGIERAVARSEREIASRGASDWRAVREDV